MIRNLGKVIILVKGERLVDGGEVLEPMMVSGNINSKELQRRVGKWAVAKGVIVSRVATSTFNQVPELI